MRSSFDLAVSLRGLRGPASTLPLCVTTDHDTRLRTRENGCQLEQIR